MDRSTQRSSSKKKKDAIYLPAIPKKASSPASIRGRLNPQVESCPSSPLFIPIKAEASPSGRVADGDGEGPPAVSGRKRRRRGRARRRGEDKHEMSASSGSARGSGGSPKDEGPASSGSRERKKDETGNVLEGRLLQRRLLSNPKDPDSDVEPGGESKRGGEPDKDKEVVEEEPLHQHDLRAQLEAVNAVLGVSDEVEQLVLRNAELTDELLATVAAALKSSPSRVALLNLNLNLIGPDGAHVLLDLLGVKPQVQALHLFGNRLCDHGAIALLSGMVELQEQRSRAAPLATIPQPGSPRPAALAITPFSLSELDIGGNGLSGNGVKALASYMRRSRLRYLGLARTAGADLAAWKELFDSLKGNDSLSELILDENDLGDPGVRLLADVLKVNAGLRRVDLDANGIGDVGGNELVAALLCRGRRPLRRLSLARNRLGSGLMRRIREELDPQ
ncbi:ribonuclease inhibitor [Stigmatopora argus]